MSEIKIDKSFVIKSLEKNESRVIVKSIINLAHNLGLEVSAEGIEDNKTQEFIRELHCDYMQGYYISKPLTGDKIDQWIKTEYSKQA